MHCRFETCFTRPDREREASLYSNSDERIMRRLLLWVKPDPSTYLKLLQICIDAMARKQGSMIHQHIISNGLGSDATLNTKMIIFHSLFSDMVSAHKVFDQMSQRTIVSWSALLSGNCQNGHFTDSLNVFRRMRCSGVKGNQFTYSSAFKACTHLPSFLCGLQIHGCLQKSRFVDNVFVQSALVDFYSNCGTMEDANCVFESMSGKDLVCWNTMIGGFAVQGFAGSSFSVFRLMIREGIPPNCFTFGNLLNVCARGGHLLRVSKIHKYIVQLGFEEHNLLLGLLVDAYAKCGSTKSAYHLFHSTSFKNALSCTAMISGYARQGIHLHQALDLFTEMHRTGIGMDDVLLCSVINICADIASLTLGRQLHALVIKYCPGCDAPTGNVLIDMYAKSGDLVDANRVFDDMVNKDVISWSSLISGNAKHGCGRTAISLFRMMVSEGFKPNDVTFLSLLFACSHSGLVDEGRDFFTLMVSRYNIAPNKQHYSCMVDLFSRAGKLDEAFSLIKSMHIDPNTSMWNAILGACSIHGSATLGEVAAWNLFSLDPENSTGYVVLSSIYAAGSLWEKAWTMRALMEQRCLKKSQGCSYVFPTVDETKLLPT